MSIHRELTALFDPGLAPQRARDEHLSPADRDNARPRDARYGLAAAIAGLYQGQVSERSALEDAAE